MAHQGLFQSQKQVQSQVLAPQLRQSLKILQVPAQELRNTILEELEINPTLEELPSGSISLESAEEPEPLPTLEGEEMLSSSTEDDTFLEKIAEADETWRYQLAEENRLTPYTAEQAERRQHFFESIPTESSLQEHLLAEARLSGADEEQIKDLELIIGYLDDNGFLSSPVEEIASTSKRSKKAVEKALALLRTLEPIGLGAHDIRECLIWQLEASPCPNNALAIRLLKDYYPLFIRRRIPELAKALGIKQEEVQSLFELISGLDPAPGRKFKEDQNQVVVPDLTIEKVGNDWIISLESEYIPRLRLSPTYRSLIQAGTLSPQEKTYIRDKIRSGELLMSSIAQRQETIRRIAEQILNLQKDFFESGISQLRPMNMQQIAKALGLHETTISRAVANKYISTPHGLFEMKAFFTSGYSNDKGENVSAKSVKEKIQKLIEAEDPTSPLNDQKIAEALANNDLKIARRTIAKYREELGILPTHLRRRF